MIKIKSMALTFLCAAIILGAGYLVIVESGKKVLEKERILEEARYESTSSNIFYGKIEEDIELFPWNYYPDNETVSEVYPQFYQMLLDYGDSMEEAKEKTDWYLYQMIACESHERVEDIWKVYQKKQKKIVDSLVMTENSPIGPVYFYQDMLEVNQSQYQVRIACSEWHIVSFICQEISAEEWDRARWEEGKDRLAKTLEESELELAACFDYMVLMSSQDLFTMYDEDGHYIHGHLAGLRWLDNILEGNVDEEDMPQELSDLMKNRGVSYSEEKDSAASSKGMEYDKEVTAVQPSEEVLEETEGYSYQIVELKDMILLLMQGEHTIGIYYDPVRQRFCGYNYFNEY